MVRCFLKVPLEGPRHLLGTVGLGSQLIPVLTVLGVLQRSSEVGLCHFH